MEAYKVVRQVKRKSQKPVYKSATDFGRVTHFPIGKTVKPHKGCGPFTAFDTLEHAKEWIENRDKPNIILRVTGVLSEFEDLWTADNVHNRAIPNRIHWITNVPKVVTAFPTGTVFLSELIVLEEVYRKKED